MNSRNGSSLKNKIKEKNERTKSKERRGEKRRGKEIVNLPGHKLFKKTLKWHMERHGKRVWEGGNREKRDRKSGGRGKGGRRVCDCLAFPVITPTH